MTKDIFFCKSYRVSFRDPGFTGIPPGLFLFSGKWKINTGKISKLWATLEISGNIGWIFKDGMTNCLRLKILNYNFLLRGNEDKNHHSSLNLRQVHFGNIARLNFEMDFLGDHVTIE